MIKISLKSSGRVYQAEGETLTEALAKIKISGGSRAMSILTVEKDGVKKEKILILNGRIAQALFSQGSPTMRTIHLKQLESIL